MTAVDNTIIHQMLEISGPQNFRELDGPAVLLVRQPLACMDATGRSNAVAETVKATVTGGYRYRKALTPRYWLDRSGVRRRPNVFRGWI